MTDPEEDTQEEGTLEEEDMDTPEEEDIWEEEEEALPELDLLVEDGDHPLCPCHKQTKENWWVNCPPSSNGDQKQTQLFINQWELYWGVNNDNALMINPY